MMDELNGMLLLLTCGVGLLATLIVVAAMGAAHHFAGMFGVGIAMAVLHILEKRL